MFDDIVGGYAPDLEGEEEVQMPSLFGDVISPESKPTSNLVFSGTTGRSATNNNPLNIVDNKYFRERYEAELEPTSKSGQRKFLKFKSMEDGYNAGLEQIQIDANRNHSLKSFVYKFAPPHENPTAELVTQYASALGVDPNTPLKKINPEQLIIPMLARESSTKVTRADQVSQVEQQNMFADIIQGSPTLEMAEKVAAPGAVTGGMFDDILQGAATTEQPIETPTPQEELDFTSVMDITHGVTKGPEITQEEADHARELLGKGLHIATWPLTRVKEWVAEPLYEKLGPLVGAPMEKGFVSTPTPLDAMMRPGEAGQVGGAPVEGDVDVTTPTYRELVTSSADAFLFGKLAKIPELMAASKAGTLTRFKEMRKPELLWDNPALGKPVYQEVFKTKLDSTLGPAGTEVIGPTLREGHALMSSELASAKYTPPLQIGSWRRDFGTSMKTNERILSELDGLAPGMKQWAWADVKASENAALRQVKIGEERLKGVMETVGGRDTGDKLGVIAISERPEGLTALKNSGVTTIPKANIAERTAINSIRNDFHELLVRINEGRVAAGLQPIPTDLNYVTFMRNMVKQEINPVLATNAEIKRAALVPFKFEKKVVGGREEVATNLFDIFKNYQIQAERHLNISPHVEKINKFVLEEMVLPNGTKVKSLAETNPVVADALLQYAKSISGRYGQAFTESWGWAERNLSAVSNNVVVAMIGAYPKSVLNQVGAITGASTLVNNPATLLKGLKKIGDADAWKFAMTNSRVLAQRKMDVVFEDLFGGGSRFWGELKHKSMMPLEAMDHSIATGIWHAGYEDALAKGLSGRKAFDWADEVVIKSQGSASAIDRANIQRTMFGKALTGLQTFTIADYNLIGREILGLGNPTKSALSKTASAASMIATGLAMNLFYRNVMGMAPPNPEPIEAFQRAKEGGASNISAAMVAGKEVATKYAPIVGSMAMGKTPFGPAGGLVADLTSGYKSLPEAAMTFGGVPGANVLSRLYRSEPGMELRDKLEQLTTLPLAPRDRLRLPPMTAKEALLGRLDILPSKQVPGKWETWFREGLEKLKSR